jgi:peptidoglycan/xylan/chitin deacetylase (PgdA/CDA1 family)
MYFQNLFNVGRNNIDKLFPHGLIFLYHRISEVNNDPFQLCVAPDNFDSQIKYLNEKFNTISLQEMAKGIHSGRMQKNTISITFDDGYEDNLVNALPILDKYKVPVTVFVTSGKLDDAEPFYWDRNTKQQDQGRSMSKKQIIELSKSSLIEIGSHTLSHPHLVKLNKDLQEEEISKSKSDLEKIIKKQVVSFSYPFGTREDVTPDIEKIVKSAEYQFACANWAGFVVESTDRYLLPRIIIRNWGIESFKENLKFWL